MLYYNIGKIINEHKSWGNKFIENLAADIKLSFPNAKGYSVRNLKYMSKFASTYLMTICADGVCTNSVVTMLQSWIRLKEKKQKDWYIRKDRRKMAGRHNVLIHQIESGLV